MILEMFTIFDIQAERALQPILRENIQIAMRDFEMTVSTQKPFCDNPDDYTLYAIGKWNDETMLTEPCDPKRIYTGLEACKNRKKRQDKLHGLQMEIDNLQSPGGTD